jgi:hypothetical protein
MVPLGSLSISDPLEITVRNKVRIENIHVGKLFLRVISRES